MKITGSSNLKSSPSVSFKDAFNSFFKSGSNVDRVVKIAISGWLLYYWGPWKGGGSVLLLTGLEKGFNCLFPNSSESDSSPKNESPKISSERTNFYVLPFDESDRFRFSRREDTVDSFSHRPLMASFSHRQQPEIAKDPIEFIDGAEDRRGRTFQSILASLDIQLESDNDWVQQVFPTDRPSSVLEDAQDWVLSSENIRDLREPSRQKKIHFAYERILRFYHLTNLDWVKSSNLPFWITEENHNFSRLSRIIRSLRLAGLDRDAQDLFQRLKHIYDQNTTAKEYFQESFSHWERAAKSPL